MGNNDTAQHDYVTQSQFEALLERLSILDTLQAKLESMEQLLKASNAKVLSLETKVLSLETEVTAKDKTIMELRGKANSLEQYNRKWSIRINDLHLPHADETETKDVMQTVYDKVLLPIFQGAVSSGLLKTIPDCNSVLETAHILPANETETKDVMQTVYDKVLLPIFQGAVSSGLLKTIPDCNSVLETAHILPAKSNDRPKPIIARFYSRNIRALVFRLKREYAPTKTVTTSSSTNNRRGEATKKVYRYPFYEDLTRETFNLLQALLKDPRTGPVWTISGNIRFKLQGEDTVRKVVSIYDSVEKILGR
jgi:hypothetical protein